MKVDRGKLLKYTIVGICFWFLNYNSSLGRYDDQITNCRLGNRAITSQNAKGWVIAEHTRHAASARTRHPEDHRAVLTYHRIHKSLDRIVRTPCPDRYHRPGPFG